MKLTKSQLNHIIQEELQSALKKTQPDGGEPSTQLDYIEDLVERTLYKIRHIEATLAGHPGGLTP